MGTLHQRQSCVHFFTLLIPLSKKIAPGCLPWGFMTIAYLLTFRMIRMVTQRLQDKQYGEIFTG